MVKENNIIHRLLFSVICAIFVFTLIITVVTAEENILSNEDFLLKINLPKTYLEENYPDYFVENIERVNIIFGKPVKWKITLSKNNKTAMIIHETPAISMETSISFNDKFWFKNITLSTEYPEIYENINLHIKIPLMDNIKISSEIDCSQNSLDKINFVLPKLNQTQVIALKGLRKDMLADEKHNTIKNTQKIVAFSQVNIFTININYFHKNNVEKIF